jgi:hypothetical protein
MVPILGLALALAACGNSDGILGVDRGLVQFVLTSGGDVPIAAADGGSTVASASGLLEDGDHPDRYHPFFESANVTFSSILARNLDGVLVDVGMEELPVTVDVMLMDRGRRVVLPDGDLPSATYDQVVVVMTAVQGVTHDGTTITIEPPGGGWTAIVPICPFTVDGGEMTVVELELNLGRSFRWMGDRFHFQPRFVCEQAEP